MTFDVDRIDWSDRFWSKAAPEALSGCWLWMGAVDHGGYGHCRIRGLDVSAHRHALSAFLGRPIRDGLRACHRCDVRLCINPLHLFEGTQLDNLRDMVSKGRQARGEKNARARLTEGAVREARRAAKAGEPHLSISRRLGIKRSNLHLILKGGSWTHVLEVAS